METKIDFNFNSNITSFMGVNPSSLDLEAVKQIENIRFICSGISAIGCIFIIIVYLIMCINYRCQKTFNNNNEIEDALSESSNSNENLIDNNYNKNAINKGLKVNRTKSTYSQNKKKMGIGNDLIFFLIITNLGWCVGSFLGKDGFYSAQEKSNPICIAQAFIQNYFELSSICWNTIISRVTFLGTRKTYSDMKKLKMQMVIFFVYCNVIPLILSLGPYITESFGPSGVWCWLDLYSMDAYSYIWIVVINIFNWTNIFYSVVTLLMASKYFSQRKKEINNDVQKEKEFNFLSKYVFILRVFPIVLIVSRGPSTINRLHSLIMGYDSSILFVIHTVAYSLIGFFNAIFYSYFYRNAFFCCKNQ